MIRNNFVTVEVHAVNHGDVLAGVAGARDRPVGSILCDGFSWIFGDDDGREIDRRPLATRVQVLRQGVVEGANDAGSGHECSSGQITRRDVVPFTAASPGGPRLRPGDAAGFEAPPTASPAADSDWCEPRGITRVMSGRLHGGLYAVIP